MAVILSVSSTLSRLQWRVLLTALLAVSLTGCITAEQKLREEPKNLVWPAPPEQPRIKYLRSYYGQSDFAVTDDLRARMFGVEYKGLHLSKPYGVTVNKDGSKMYVTDTMAGGIVVFDLKKEKVFRLPIDATGSLKSPVEVRVDDRGRIYVSDGFGHRLVVYSPAGTTLFTLGSAQRMKRPTGLALDDKRDRLYVSDTPNHRVLVYSLDGEFIREVGERGINPGQFNFPTNLAVDGKGRLIVTDSGNFRIQMFSPEGEFLSDFGSIGDGFGNFARPKGVGVDSEGHVYVVDAAFANVQIFNDTGKLLLFFGALGRDPGYFWLPAGLYVAQDDKIYVADSINGRIQVFQYLKEEEGISQSK